MKDRPFRLGLIFIILILFICVSISPSIIGTVEQITNPTIDNFSFNSYKEDFGLLAYWSFDEGSGNLAHDYSGNGYNGIITGASWTTGYSSYALDFDGTDNAVSVDTYSRELGFNKTDDYKISFWIKSTSTHSGMIYHLNSDFYILPTAYIRLNSNGTLEAKIQSTESCRVQIFSNDSYNDGLWHYIECIYYGNSIDPALELYIDQEFIGSNTDWLCPMSNIQFNKAKIGINSYDSTECFDGIIDEVKVFKIPGGNKPPNPPIISGPTSGSISDDYNYTFITTDKDGDDLYLLVDWGDNTNTGWIGPYSSDEEVKLSPSWSENGVYNIKAKAKDVYEYEGEWTDPFVVAITEKTILIGFITNKSLIGDLTFVKAKFLIYIGLNPLVVRFYSTGEDVVISKKYIGLLGERYIMGIFNGIAI